MRRVIVSVRGRVQGVGYRAAVYRRMILLPVTGYVRNMPDGSVRLDIQGDETDVEEALEIAAEGSPFSSVSAIEVTEAAIGADYDSFNIEK